MWMDTQTQTQLSSSNQTKLTFSQVSIKKAAYPTQQTVGR